MDAEVDAEQSTEGCMKGRYLISKSKGESPSPLVMLIIHPVVASVMTMAVNYMCIVPTLAFYSTTQVCNL